MGLREMQLPQTRASTQTGLVEADTHQESTSLRLYHQGDAMIEFALWATLIFSSAQWVPGPFLIPANVRTPPRTVRTGPRPAWPTRAGQ